MKKLLADYPSSSFRKYAQEFLDRYGKWGVPGFPTEVKGSRFHVIPIAWRGNIIP
jgi:hypothetical protein